MLFPKSSNALAPSLGALLLVGAVAGCVEPSPSDASEISTSPAEQLATGQVTRVLWLGAHPDDEVFAAPLMADFCLRHGASCHFAVITDGGKGNCFLSPQECGVKDSGGAPPGSLGAVRLREHEQVVAALGGQAHALALEDGASPYVAGVLARWNQQLGGSASDPTFATLVQKVEDLIAATQPDLILTFDPRHGMYCHPDHRAANTLAVVAATRRGLDPGRVLMLEATSVYLDAAGRVTRRAWIPGDPALVSYDPYAAGTASATTGAMSLYRSQFQASTILAIASMSPEAWKLPWLPLAAALVDGRFAPSAYDSICASEPWDYHGVCPRADGSTGPCW